MADLPTLHFAYDHMAARQRPELIEVYRTETGDILTATHLAYSVSDVLNNDTERTYEGSARWATVLLGAKGPN